MQPQAPKTRQQIVKEAQETLKTIHSANQKETLKHIGYYLVGVLALAGEHFLQEAAGKGSDISTFSGALAVIVFVGIFLIYGTSYVKKCLNEHSIFLFTFFDRLSACQSRELQAQVDDQFKDSRSGFGIDNVIDRIRQETLDYRCSHVVAMLSNEMHDLLVSPTNPSIFTKGTSFYIQGEFPGKSANDARIASHRSMINAIFFLDQDSTARSALLFPDGGQPGTAFRGFLLADSMAASMYRTFETVHGPGRAVQVSQATDPEWFSEHVVEYFSSYDNQWKDLLKFRIPIENLNRVRLVQIDRYRSCKKLLALDHGKLDEWKEGGRLNAFLVQNEGERESKRRIFFRQGIRHVQDETNLDSLRSVLRMHCDKNYAVGVLYEDDRAASLPGQLMFIPDFAVYDQKVAWIEEAGGKEQFTTSRGEIEGLTKQFDLIWARSAAAAKTLLEGAEPLGKGTTNAR